MIQFRKNQNWLRLFISLTFIVTLSCNALAARKPAAKTPEVDPVRKAQELESQGKVDEAVKLLTDATAQETDKSKRALESLSLAVILYRAARDPDADKRFTEAIDEGLRVPEYAYYYRGLLRKKSGQLKEAADDLRKAYNGKTPLSTEVDARFELADVYLALKDFRSAEREFLFLKKKTKSSERYPDVLLGLLRTQRKFAARGEVGCAVARELFSKFPTLSALKSWGSQLEKNELEGVKIGCRASAKDLKTRVLRLQLGGESERAGKELSDIKDGTADESAYSIDAMLANHMIAEGQVDDALKLLMKHYDSQKSRPPYLALLGKAATRAGEYQAAIAAYARAYEIAPRSKDGSNALFQAAFTSYQIQDYDGATRRFTQLVRSGASAKVIRDAKWHLAWMRYLRGDYEGALESFKELARAPKIVSRRSRRRRAVVVDSVQTDRLQYWSAMSLLKLGRPQDATLIFQSLVRDPAIGYYSVLSFYRLLTIPGAKLPPGVETRLGLMKNETNGVAAPSEEEIRQATESVAEAAADYEQPAVGGDSDASAEASDANDDAQNTEVSSETDVPPNDNVSFKDANLSGRFERARDLAYVGLRDAAQRELAEIEKRARSVPDRKLLMSEYALVENYYRSSYMGELGFGAQRLRGGLRGDSRQYWEFAYPKAWDAAVSQSAHATMVPEELIWGIMRAESHYRADAQSGVGALGLMQMMPFTGRQVANLLSMNTFETKSLLDPGVNIRLGSRYLQRLLEKFSGSVPLVAAGYNAGPHRVHAWVRNFGSLNMDEFIEHIPFLETRNYVKKVVRNYQIYSLLYSGGGHSLRWLVQPVGVQLDDRVPTHEVW